MPTATTTSSKNLLARSMTSRWPLVIGSKEPGHTARLMIGDRTRASPRHSGASERASRPSGQVQRRAAAGPLDARRRASARQPARAGQRGEHRRRPDRRTAGRRTPRRRQRPDHRPSTRSTGSAADLDAGQRRARRRSPGSRAAPRPSRSTSTTGVAPRLAASSPTAPEPAYRSRNAAPSQRPAQRDQRREQRLPGPVGGRPRAPPGGTTSRRPRRAMTRLTIARSCLVEVVGRARRRTALRRPRPQRRGALQRRVGGDQRLRRPPRAVGR